MPQRRVELTGLIELLTGKTTGNGHLQAAAGDSCSFFRGSMLLGRTFARYPPNYHGLKRSSVSVTPEVVQMRRHPFVASANCAQTSSAGP